MINVPPPTRIAIGTITVNGKQLEIYLSAEWARYFESLNSQSNSTLQSFNNFAAGAFMGLLGEGDDGGGSTSAPPGPRGLQGDPGQSGLALFMLHDDSGSDEIMAFAPDMTVKANLAGAAFTGPVSAVGDYAAAYAVSAKSSGAGAASTSATTNGDNSHYLVHYSGSSADPTPAIWWKTGTTLRFAVATNGLTAAGFTQLASLSSAGLAVTAGFGCNSKAPQGAATVAAAASDLSTVITLCNQLRAALIANGIAV